MSPMAASSSTTRPRALARTSDAEDLADLSGAGAPVNPSSLADPLGRGKRRGPDGQKNRDRRAVRLTLGGTLHLDPAVVVLDDAVAARQAQASPLPLVLRGEERLEDVLDGGGRDAGAVVADLQVRVLGGRRAVQSLLAPGDALDGDAQAPARPGGHGVDGVLQLV